MSVSDTEQGKWVFLGNDSLLGVIGMICRQLIPSSSSQPQYFQLSYFLLSRWYVFPNRKMQIPCCDFCHRNVDSKTSTEV